MKKFSYSQINTYIMCPKAYEFSYILKSPQFINSRAAFWTTIHSTLNKFFLKIKNDLENNSLFLEFKEDLSYEDMLSLYEDSWVSAWFDNFEVENSKKDEWKAILKSFYESNCWNWWYPYLLETWFKLHIEDFILTWRFDRVDKLNWIDVEVIDYKTWRFNSDCYNIDYNLQLSIQVLALKEMWLNPISAFLYFVSQDNKIEFNIWEKSLKKTVDDLVNLVGKIRWGEFDATSDKNKCERCQFNRICKSRN